MNVELPEILKTERFTMKKLTLSDKDLRML
jgi:hypothetical protein